MRLELPLLLVFLACVASQAYNPYIGEQYPYYYNSPHYRSGNTEDLRQMLFSLALPARQTTVTVTTTVRPSFSFPSFPTLSLPTIPPLRQTITNLRTSISTITCTKSTDVPCSVLVKQTSTGLLEATSESPKNTTVTEIVEEEDTVQQFTTVTPTVVQKVETTKVPNQKVPNRKVPTRKGRVDMESEWLSLLSPDFSEDYPENEPHVIQSAFHSGPYNPVPLPFFRRFEQPDIAEQRQSSFFAFLGSLFTGRSTSTIFQIKTLTLTPTCSVAGPIPQCPNV